MIWEKMWVGRPAGTHLSQSHTAGGNSPLVRDDDTNELTSHVTLLPVTDEEDEQDPSDTSLKIVLGITVVAVATFVAIKAAPHIASRMKSLKSKWKREHEEQQGDGKVASAEIATPNRCDSADFAHEVDAVLEECGASMSGAEAQKRLLALVAAAAFIADQMRALTNARIEDDDAFPELTSAMRKLTAPQITDSINRALEADSSLLSEEASAEFMRIFGGGRDLEGQFVPLRNEKIAAALRLTSGET
ncbi:hypothetical protein GCM10009716_07740 [Streptomyces sodiiphilus]|uniref:Transmembrane protein n=2 Tax=Streptomyces sodiiphilus TaxID=226217 RepID=A0ABN2NTZ3_9ACTN